MIHFLLAALIPVVSDQAADEIVKAGQFLDKAGLCPATAGNLSVRLSSEYAAISISGKHKGELTSDDVLVVDFQGKPQNTTKKPSAETLLHTVIYSLFEDVGAVLHHHTLNGTVLSRLMANEKSFVTEGYEIHKAFRGHPTHESRVEIPIFENSQDYPALAAEVAAYLQEHPETLGFFLRGHGLYTWGRDMREAKIRVETFEYLFESEIKMRMLRGL
ncbi:MAG: methylthioribulose 1-phosphate dehydratase [Verrucomicrobia bacterium]|nr:methylthioribulose 1-phosphate dehydratase [Verrucomicrobiota bacterium]